MGSDFSGCKLVICIYTYYTIRLQVFILSFSLDIWILREERVADNVQFRQNMLSLDIYFGVII